MKITKEILDKLPISELPEDYDNVEEITAEILNEFNKAADKIDFEYENQGNYTTKFVAEGKN